MSAFSIVSINPQIILADSNYYYGCSIIKPNEQIIGFDCSERILKCQDSDGTIKLVRLLGSYYEFYEKLNPSKPRVVKITHDPRTLNLTYITGFDTPDSTYSITFNSASSVYQSTVQYVKVVKELTSDAQCVSSSRVYTQRGRLTKSDIPCSDTHGLGDANGSQIVCVRCLCG